MADGYAGLQVLQHTTAARLINIRSSPEGVPGFPGTTGPYLLYDISNADQGTTYRVQTSATADFVSYAETILIGPANSVIL